MTPKRPPGPVFRPNDDDTTGDDMPTATTELRRRWKYLQDGAALGAMLTHTAREGSLEDVAAAMRAMDRDQLEAAAMAMVVIHAETTTPNPDE